MALEFFFHDNPNPCWIYDNETFRFLAVNKSCLTTYGYTEDDFIDRLTIFDLLFPEDQSQFRSYLHVAEPPQISGIWRHIHASGAVLQVCTYSHQTRLNGRFCRYVMAVNVQDMFRRIGEQALARTREDETPNATEA